MRKKEFILHIYEKDIYKEAIVFNSRTLLTNYLRENGGVFRTDALTDIGDGLVTIPTKKGISFEVEELVC